MKKVIYSALCAFILTSSAFGSAIKIYTFRNPLLLYTVSKGNDSAALALLSIRGTDPSTQDASGKTPLHYTAQSGRLALSQALLLRGADPTIEDNSGETPRSLAKKRGHDEIELLLSEWFRPVSNKRTTKPRTLPAPPIKPS